MLVLDERRRVIVPVFEIEGHGARSGSSARPSEIPFDDVVARESTLDDVFFALTGHGVSEHDAVRRRARAREGGVMTTTDVHAGPRDPFELTPAPQTDIPDGPQWLLKDSWTEATRHLHAIPRNPELLIFATIQPIMFIVLFVYVFRGSVQTPIDYVQYVIPGIFAQTVLFNSAFTGVGVADDLSKGIIDRLRSLPMYHGGGADRAHAVRRRPQRHHVRGHARRRLRRRVPLRGLAPRRPSRRPG